MGQPNLKFRIEVDNKEAIRKFHKLHRETEEFSYALHELLRDIKIGIRVVPIKEKKWYQFWK